MTRRPVWVVCCLLVPALMFGGCSSRPSEDAAGPTEDELQAAAVEILASVDARPIGGGDAFEVSEELFKLGDAPAGVSAGEVDGDDVATARQLLRSGLDQEGWEVLDEERPSGAASEIVRAVRGSLVTRVALFSTEDLAQLGAEAPPATVRVLVGVAEQGAGGPGPDWTDVP